MNRPDNDNQFIYQIENCSKYEIRETASGKPVYIFDDHNMAFSAWGTIASRNKKNYQLLSFDHHTDTHEPFVKSKASGEYDPALLKNCHLTKEDFVFEHSFHVSNLLNNDEQIKAAYKFGYLRGYLIVCDLQSSECNNYQADDRSDGYPRAEYCSRSNAESTLKQKMLSLLSEPLIIDFDLDYFRNEDDLSGVLFETIKPLLEHASAITIAKEPTYFNRLKLDPKLNVDRALELLLGNIEAL